MSTTETATDWELQAKRVAAAARAEGYTLLISDGGNWWFASPDSEWDFPVTRYRLSTPGIERTVAHALEEDALFRNAWSSERCNALGIDSGLEQPV